MGLYFYFRRLIGWKTRRVLSVPCFKQRQESSTIGFSPCRHPLYLILLIHSSQGCPPISSYQVPKRLMLGWPSKARSRPDRTCLKKFPFCGQLSFLPKHIYYISTHCFLDIFQDNSIDCLIQKKENTKIQKKVVHVWNKDFLSKNGFSQKDWNLESIKDSRYNWTRRVDFFCSLLFSLLLPPGC